MQRPLNGRAPKLVTPAGTVDCHIHFYTEGHAGQPGGPPPPAPATIAHYRQFQKWLGLERVVIVQPNAFQFDNSCLLECLEEMGADARGVVSVHPDMSDAELERMHALGVRGARIMNLPGGAAKLDMLKAVEARVRPLGWHPIVQFDGREIFDHLPLLNSIEGTWIFDHVGKFLEPVSPDSREFTAMLKLADRGNCYFKLCAPYETSKTGAPSFEDVGRLARKLVETAPERCIWGSNWPHVGVKPENYPDDVDLLDVLLDWAPDAATRKLILTDNPSRLYGF